MLRQVRVTLENKPGALARVVGIISAMGSNIETLAVAPDRRRPGVSRLILAAEFDGEGLRWALGKINNLVNVMEAEEDAGRETPSAQRGEKGRMKNDGEGLAEREGFEARSFPE